MTIAVKTHTIFSRFAQSRPWATGRRSDVAFAVLGDTSGLELPGFRLDINDVSEHVHTSASGSVGGLAVGQPGSR